MEKAVEKNWKVSSIFAVNNFRNLLKSFLNIPSLLWTTIKSLQAEKEVLETKVSGFQAEINMLLARMAVLEGQKNKNSRNSSKPPSTDKGRKKKVAKNSRTGSGRPSGAQPGNEGRALHPVSPPRYLVGYKVGFCTCEAGLRNGPVQDVEKRQVFNMGKLKIEVAGHRAETRPCPQCGKPMEGAFPEDAKAPVQYGANVRAAIMDLNTQHFLSYGRIQIFFKDWFGQPTSGGVVYGSLQKGHEVPNGVYRGRLVETLLGQKVLHTDGTGCTLGGKRNWFHVLSTPKLTLLHPHEGRGGLAIGDMGVLPVFTGRAIHGSYSGYPGYGNCGHGLCNAHHLRGLLFFEEEQKAIWAMHLGIFPAAWKCMWACSKNRERPVWVGRIWKTIKNAITKYYNRAMGGCRPRPRPNPMQGEDRPNTPNMIFSAGWRTNRTRPRPWPL